MRVLQSHYFLLSTLILLNSHNMKFVASEGLICSPFHFDFASSPHNHGKLVSGCLLYGPAQSQPNLKSILEVSEQGGEPDSHGWTRCRDCLLRNGDIVVRTANVSSKDSVLDLSWSHWGEFFHDAANDQIHATVQHSPSDVNENFEQRETYIITRPVYVLPMITFHIGHVLVDLLEQVYNSMMTHYGEVRRDALIIIDVSNKSERDVLQEILLTLSSSDINGHNNFYQIMRDTLTSSSLLSFKMFGQLQEFSHSADIVFSDLHVGLDISDTYYQLGYAYHPCLFTLGTGNSELLSLSERYQRFAAYILQFAVSEIDVKTERPATVSVSPSVKVLFVQRTTNRLLLNLDAVTDRAIALGLEWSTEALESLSFPQQLPLFQETDIIVAIAGTALHNMLFMRPGVTAAVIIMQPGWCEWSWMYANQAVLLGIRPFIYCDATASEDDDRFRFSQATRRFWRLGPRETKTNNVTLDVQNMGELLRLAQQHVLSVRKSGVEYVHKDVICPGEPPEVALSNAPHSLDLTRTSSPDSGRGSGILEISIYEVVVHPKQHSDDNWTVGLAAEIGLPAVINQYRAFLESMPHLALCFQIHNLNDDDSNDSDRPDASATDSSCFPVHRFNFPAKLFVSIGNDAPLQAAHLWVQVTTTGGKIRHSDMYHVFDCRLHDGGLSLLNPIAWGQHLQSLFVTIREDCIDHSSQQQHAPQLITFPTQHYSTADTLQCRNDRQLSFDARRFSNRRVLQRGIFHFCRLEANLTHANCLRVLRELLRRAASVSAQMTHSLPHVQYLPTPGNPFVFVHIEKTGGTTMREFITESADRQGLQYFVPCHGGVHCITHGLPADTSHLGNVSIVAGHFFWNVWDRLPVCSGGGRNSSPVSKEKSAASLKPPETVSRSTADRGSHATCAPSCMVIGRHPVDRAISYYYQRCYSSPGCLGYQRRINDLAPDELDYITVHQRAAEYWNGSDSSDSDSDGGGEYQRLLIVNDEGMSDAACRTIAGLKATTGVVLDDEGPAMSLPPPLTLEETNLALANVRTCVVGLLERWNETQSVFSAWFPWLDFETNKNRRKMYLYSGKETENDLRPELREVLVRHNHCDMLLYEEMKRLFDLQLMAMQGEKLFY